MTRKLLSFFLVFLIGIILTSAIAHAQSKVGTFPDALMAEAKKNGWTVISMKNDWKVILAVAFGSRAERLQPFLNAMGFHSE